MLSTDRRVHGDRFVREGLLDFAVNVRQGRPPALRAALVAALDEESYPDDRDAQAAIAARHQVDVDQVLTLNGACEGFWLLAQALRPCRAVSIQPMFSEGELALRATGAQVTRLILRPPTWQLDPSQVSQVADFVVVTNPNNPTGRLESAATLSALAKPGRVLLIDESFMDFARDRESLAGELDLPGVVVLRSCTKLWSLAGIRAGYLLADPAIVTMLRQQRQPWPVNALACAALRFAASERATAERRIAENDSDRADLTRRLAAIARLRVYPSSTNFLLVEAPDRVDVPLELRARGIAVRPAASFPGLTDEFFRVAVRRASDNGRLVRELAGVMARA
jgi:histidinol-phosphate/aromatic aminotransferase/cobyric acid decarboxylase-like protein